MRTTLIVEFHALFLAILAVIGPFGLLLYLLPSATSIYWAWNISDPRSAILIGSAYAGATVYYVLLFRASDWLQVRYGLGGLIVFSLALLAATAVHWQVFKRPLSSGSVSITSCHSATARASSVKGAGSL